MALTSGTTSDVAVSAGPGDLTINLEYDTAAQGAPAGFRNSIQAAADMLSSLIHNSISINIGIGYGDIPFFDQTVTGGGAEGGVQNAFSESYSSLRSQLLSHASTAQVSAAINALPNTSTLNGVGDIDVAYAEERALGLAPASDATVDGDAGFATDIPQAQLVGVALHELTHAMGRIDGTWVLSLFRYASAGIHDFAGSIPTGPSYLSLDNGSTKLADFGRNSDDSDFLNPPDSTLTPNDPFNEFYDGNTLQSMTPLDLTVMGLLGFNVAPQLGSGVMTQTASGQLDMLGFGGTQLQSSALSPSTFFPIVASGDFNGDGNEDLVTQSADGQIDFAYFNGAGQFFASTLVNGQYAHVGGAGSNFAGFGGPALVSQLPSGQIDLLRFAGVSLTGSELLNGSYGTVVAAGTFAGPGSPTEIATQNSATGQIDLLQFNGANLVGSNLLPGGYFPVKGAEDFNKDGTSDLLTQSSGGLIDHLIFANNQITGSYAYDSAFPGLNVTAGTGVVQNVFGV
jgi:hypothetical protein